MEGVCIDPVTAQVIMTFFEFFNLLVLSIVSRYRLMVFLK